MVYRLFPDFTDADIARVIFYALHVQSPRHKIRYQGAWEQMPGDTKAHKLYAVRAVSGHAQCSIHDPLRFAAQAPSTMKAHISGLFHITDIDHISSILSKGLVPGGEKEHNRKILDLHFTAFSPFETNQANNGGAIIASRLREAQAKGKALIQISLDVDRAWQSLRMCVANGYFLC